MLKNQRIAVVGYGSQGRAQATSLFRAGMDVCVGLRKNGKSWKKALDEDISVKTIEDACKWANIIHILIPDEVQAEVYKRDIEPNLQEGNVLSFSHGFNIVYKLIRPPKNLDVILVSPKAPGSEILENKNVPSAIAVWQDFSTHAKETALALAEAMNFKTFECTFEQETFENLFAEQAVLCGGLPELVKKASGILLEKGYPKELVEAEILHQLRLITNLFHKSGIEGMYKEVSNTAEYGGRTAGPKIIDEHVEKSMRKVLERIENGEFAEEFGDVTRKSSG
jgi:ketol-acid reductoisomerase